MNLDLHGISPTLNITATKPQRNILLRLLSAVARLTRFEGRGHKTFPKGPPFAYVFWKQILKKIIKGGSIGFFSPLSAPLFVRYQKTLF